MGKIWKKKRTLLKMADWIELDRVDPVANAYGAG